MLLTADVDRFVIENEEMEVADNLIFLGAKTERETGCAGEINNELN